MGEVTYKFNGSAASEVVKDFAAIKREPTIAEYVVEMSRLSDAAEARQTEYRDLMAKRDALQERLIAITRTSNIVKGIFAVVLVATMIVHWVLW